MGTTRLIFLGTAGIFLVYFGNVVMGAAGLGVFLSDVGEMLTLFVACIGFVITTLNYERAREIPHKDSTKGETSEDERHEQQIDKR